jgi:hypothetical protein
MKNNQSIRVSTGFNLEYAKSVLTTDIDCKDSLFDLVDNSIDAARQALLNASQPTDPDFVHESFEGFEISIGVHENEIWLEDNCSGIDRDEIQSRLLVVGEKPKQPKAIGRFGTGLKRALLKLGAEYEIITNNNKLTYVMKFSSNDLTSTKDSIEAEYFEDNERTFTRIGIKSLSKAAKMEISDNPAWKKDFRQELGIRYHLFIQKGLTIKVNNVPVEGYCPSLRAVANVQIQHETYSDLPGGIKAEIRAGMHGDYILPGEEDYTEKVNEDLTPEYGWYFVCNDRVVKIACRDNKFGWSKKWHPEYYGFIGWVHFIGDADNMPWNSKKTDIEPNSEVFSAIKDHLKLYADRYRQENRKLKKAQKGHRELIPEDAKSRQQIGLDFTSQSPGGRTVEPFNQPQVASPKDTTEHVINDDPKPDKSRPGPLLRPPRPRKKIEASESISEALSRLDSGKVSNLYYSLCEIDLVKHPILASIGAWAFFETLNRKAGSSEALTSYFNSKISVWFAHDRTTAKTYRKLLADISEMGNLDKHDDSYYTIDARPLALKFKKLEPCIVRIVEDAIAGDKNQ